jgi:alkanesulfonate monooxygenase
VRLHVIVRETSEEAWADADRLISHLTDDDIAAARRNYASMDSVGQKRMAALHGGKPRRWWSAPICGPVSASCAAVPGTALVGSAEEVAARLNEYVELGVDSFVLSGYPHLEEAIRFAELVFPLLPGKTPVTLRDRTLTGGRSISAPRRKAPEETLTGSPVRIHFFGRSVIDPRCRPAYQPDVFGAIAESERESVVR